MIRGINMEWWFERDMVFLITVVCISSIFIYALELPTYTHLSNNNSTTPTNYTTIPANTIRIGNCIFPLKLYNNMTAPQIENATLICYK
jgi:hypothetical protein